MNKKLLMLILMTGLPARFLMAQTFQSGHVGASIPDNASYFYLDINVSGLPASTNGSFGIESVCIDIEHPRNRDLNISLISPDNERTVLDEYAAGANYTNTCFNSTSPNIIVEGTAPFTGAYRPLGDLGKFNLNKNPNGTWRLRIQDVTPGNIGKVNSWKITFSSSPAQPFTSSNLPIMVLNTNGKTIIRNERIIIDMGIILNESGGKNNITDPWSHYSGKANIRYRGQSSMMFPKRGYALDTKMEDGIEDRDFPLLGMPAEHKWVLYASYNDKTLLRDVFTYNLFADMGNISVRSRYVDLVLNGEYRGVYIVQEKIKRGKHRVPVKRLGPEHLEGDEITGGYIVSVDKWSDKRDSWTSKYASNTNNDKVRFQYVYPKPHNIQQVHKDYIRNYFHAFEDALMAQNWKDPENGYRKYIHLNSFYDTFIINELSWDVDGYRASSYFWKDRDSELGKLVSGPMWDYDMAWYNANFGGGNSVSGWQYDYGYNWQQGNPADCTYVVPFWWRRMMEDPQYVDDLNCRYRNHRLDQLSKESLYARIDHMAVQIKEGRERNFDRWPILGKWVYSNVTPVAKTYDDEIRQLKDWIGLRLDWLDKNLPGFCKNVGIEEAEPLISSINAYPNPARDVVNLSYYIREGAKVKIEIVNTMGTTVKRIFEGNQSPGLYQNPININDLSNGMYIVLLRVEDKVFHRKLVKNS